MLIALNKLTVIVLNISLICMLLPLFWMSLQKTPMYVVAGVIVTVLSTFSFLLLIWAEVFALWILSTYVGMITILFLFIVIAYNWRMNNRKNSGTKSPGSVERTTVKGLGIFTFLFEVPLLNWCLIAVVCLCFISAVLLCCGYDTKLPVYILSRISAVLALYVYIFKPNAQINTKVFPQGNFYPARDLKIIGQSGKFTNCMLSEYWGLPNFFLLQWLCYLPLIGIISYNFFSTDGIIIMLGFLGIGWAAHLVIFIWTNRLDYYFRYGDTESLWAFQYVSMYTLQASWPLVFIIAVANPFSGPHNLRIPPLPDIETGSMYTKDILVAGSPIVVKEVKIDECAVCGTQKVLNVLMDSKESFSKSQGASAAAAKKYGMVVDQKVPFTPKVSPQYILLVSHKGLSDLNSSELSLSSLRNTACSLYHLSFLEKPSIKTEEQLMRALYQHQIDSKVLGLVNKAIKLALEQSTGINQQIAEKLLTDSSGSWEFKTDTPAQKLYHHQLNLRKMYFTACLTGKKEWIEMANKASIGFVKKGTLS